MRNYSKENIQDLHTFFVCSRMLVLFLLAHIFRLLQAARTFSKENKHTFSFAAGCSHCLYNTLRLPKNAL